MLYGHAHRRFTMERRLAGKHMVTGDAERIDVATVIELFSVDLFGTHVQRRPHRHADLRQVDAFAGLRELRQTEVGHLRFPLRVMRMFSGLMSR